MKIVTKSEFYLLRNIAHVQPSLSRVDAERIHAFISTRLDYCNALFSSLQKKSLDKREMTQNAAARLLTVP